MQMLEKTISNIIRNLRRKGKAEGVILSDSKTQIIISKVSDEELKRNIQGITDIACFEGVEPARESWYQINGMIRPLINAGIIELGKYLPYLPGLDKNILYRAIGMQIGKGTTIAPRVQFDYFHPELIEFGNNCLVGDGAEFWTHDYRIDSFRIGNINIGNNVFIGSEAVIGPGTEIGDGAKVNLRAFLYGEKIPAGATVKGQPKSRYERPNTRE